MDQRLYQCTHSTYSDLYQLAEEGKVLELHVAQFNSNQQFYWVLNIVSSRRFATLFPEVISKEVALSYDNDKWFSVLVSLIKMGSKQSFEEYFDQRRFQTFSEVYKNSILKRYLVSFNDEGFANRLLQLGARVDSATLAAVSPENDNFFWMLSHARKRHVTAWLNEQLRKQLALLKHSANFTPTAKSHLQQGSGNWQQTEFSQLKKFLQKVNDYHHCFYPNNNADWLVAAVLCGHLELFEQCIENPRLINEKASNGMIALVEACGRQHSDWAITKLLTAGADVNRRDSNNHSALFSALARSEKHIEVVSQLVAAGADVNHRDFTHATLLYTLKPHLPEDIILLLEQCGAQAFAPYEQIEMLA